MAAGADVRAITVRQPHAWAIIYGGKDVENRTRNIAGRYRGPVAIHAGLHAFEQDNMSSRAHRAAHGSEVGTAIVFGAIIGVVDLVDVHQCDRAMGCWCHDPVTSAVKYSITYLRQEQGRVCSPWAQDATDKRWVINHLVLENPRPLAQPIPAKGRLGLWTLPDDLAEQVTA